MDLYLGCSVKHVLGNVKVEPVDISTMLEHGNIVGTFVYDDGFRIPSDSEDKYYDLDLSLWSMRIC